MCSYLPDWSPDGSRIAFTCVVNDNPEVCAVNADGSGRRRLTSSPGFDGHPSWSPDGRKIAFASVRDGGGRIYLMDADGGNQVRLTSGPDSDELPE